MASKAKSSRGPTKPNQAPRKRKGRSRANGNRYVPVLSQMGMSLGNLRPQTAPQGVSVGVMIPQSYFRFEGKAQPLTDIGGMGDSLRVCGSDLFAFPIKSGSSTAAAGFGSTAAYYQILSPVGISPRLTNVEEMFQYYAIRKIQVMYSPEVATSKSVSLALGVLQDLSIDLDVTAPTQQQLLELTPSMKLPVYQPGSIVYTHTGTRLWECDKETIVDNEYQCALGCTLVGSDLTTSVQYGSLWLEYVIDFYKPTMLITAPSRLRSRALRLELMAAGLPWHKTKKECKTLSCPPPRDKLETSERPSEFKRVSQEEAEDTGTDSPVLIKSLRGLTVYTDSGSKDKQQAPLALQEKGPVSVRGAR